MHVFAGVSLLCVSTAVAVARTLSAHAAFYSWFSSCGLEISRHRGYGQSACKGFGFIGAPRLSPTQMAWAGRALVVLLVAAAVPVAAELRSALLLAALATFHLYFTQLYCEAHVGAHVIVLVQHTLLLSALSPALPAIGAPADDLHVRAATLTAWLCKIVLTTAYCSAGLHKLANFWRGKRNWVDGATLQAFIFEAHLLATPETRTSFGLPTPFTHTLQKLAMKFPRALLMPMSIKAVAFETLAPLVLLAPPGLVSVPFAISGVGFHYGICLLQNIDFVSWWGPAYAFFFFDPCTAADGALFEQFASGLAASYELAPIRTVLAVTYVAVHLALLVVLRYFPMDVLPFSSYPMFGNTIDLFDPSSRKWHWLTEKPHATGTLKNYCFPFCREQHVREAELPKLPFKYVLFGHGGGPDVMYSNVELTPSLDRALERMRACGRRGKGVYTDNSALAELLDALSAAQIAFAAAPRMSVSVRDESKSECGPSRCAKSDPLVEKPMLVERRKQAMGA
jgi:hypothetical protein